VTRLADVPEPSRYLLVPGSAQCSKLGSGIGTRASVASYFLFVADSVHQPYYRPNFGGKAIGSLYDRKDALDSSSPGRLLSDYTGRCQYLQREFNDAGVVLEDMIDVQSALFILADQYLGSSRPAS